MAFDHPFLGTPDRAVTAGWACMIKRRASGGKGWSQMLLQFIHHPEELAWPHPSQVASKASTSLRRPLALGAPGSARGAGTTPERASPGTSGTGGPAAGCSGGTVHR